MSVRSLENFSLIYETKEVQSCLWDENLKFLQIELSSVLVHSW